MIIDNKIDIKVSKKNIVHLKKIGYDVKLKEVVAIDSSELNEGSHIKVKVRCDVCGHEKELMYQKYIKNIRNGNIYVCSSKCSQEKVKKTSLEKYGSEYYTRTKEYKDSVKKTSLERYGCEHFTQNEDIKNKVKKTNKERYGSEDILSSNIIREKIKNTNIKRYGVENVFSSDVIKEKMRKTFLEKYGVDWSSKNKDVIEKCKKTNIEKYGKSSVLQTEKIKEKSSKSYLEKYGVPIGTLTEEMIRNMKNKKKKNWIENVLKKNKDLKLIEINESDKIYVFDNLSCGHRFKIPFVNLNVRNSARTTICTTCNPIEKNHSGLEVQMSNFIKQNYKGQTLENIKILKPFETDIYLPDLKLAFEFNGIYITRQRKHRSL